LKIKCQTKIEVERNVVGIYSIPLPFVSLAIHTSNNIQNQMLSSVVHFGKKQTYTMKRSLLLLAFLIISGGIVFADNPDLIKTSNGDLEIHPISHATLALVWNGKTIYVDPTGGEKAFSKFSKPDLILITDTHGDHLNNETLQAVESNKATFVVPQAVADRFPADLAKSVIILGNGDTQEVMGISIEAIPMYNLPESDDAFHKKGHGNGYVLTMGGKRIYLAGDTEDIPEMRTLKDIDVAFVCMNLPYTMDIHQASSAVLEFNPKIVYPYHFRGQGGLSDVEKFKAMVNEGNANIDVRLRQWYPQ